jgi:hypothetical protein
MDGEIIMETGKITHQTVCVEIIYNFKLLNRT